MWNELFSLLSLYEFCVNIFHQFSFVISFYLTSTTTQLFLLVDKLEIESALTAQTEHAGAFSSISLRQPERIIWTPEGRIWAHSHALGHVSNAFVQRNPHRCWQQAHFCTVFGPDIGNQYSLINNVGFSNFIRTHAALETMPVAKKWSFCVSGKLSKSFWVWLQSVSKSIFEPYLSTQQCLLLLTVSLQSLSF